MTLLEDELFDLTAMAMEYFKEHLEPTLPEITYFGADFLDFTSFASKFLLEIHIMFHGKIIIPLLAATHTLFKTFF